MQQAEVATGAVVVISVLVLLLVLGLVAVVLVTLRLRTARERIVELETEPDDLISEGPVQSPLPRSLLAAERAMKSVIGTAAKLREQGVGGLLMTSIDDLSRWAMEDRSEVARLAAEDGTITLFFSDIEGSTALNAELGDQGWVRLLIAHDTLVRAHVERRQGHIVKSQGDGFMVVFGSPVDAVRPVSASSARWPRNGPGGCAVRRSGSVSGFTRGRLSPVTETSSGRPWPPLPGSAPGRRRRDPGDPSGGRRPRRRPPLRVEERAHGRAQRAARQPGAVARRTGARGCLTHAVWSASRALPARASPPSPRPTSPLSTYRRPDGRLPPRRPDAGGARAARPQGLAGDVRRPGVRRAAAPAVLTRYADAVGLTHPVSPHQLRHFLFTWLKTQGIDDALIQPYSGHESRQFLEIYSRLDLADAQQHYNEAITRFPA